MTDAPQPAPQRPPGEAVVVAGASAGGVEALLTLVRSFPPDFPHPVLVVLHVSPAGTSALPAILARACNLPVAAALDGEPVLPGQVYVAPPDRHLVVEGGHLHLSQAPRENGHRPAIDPTMRTAAATYDGGTIGIVLSGLRDDGTAGLIAIKAHGGATIVQDPHEALYPAMPQSAIAHVEPDAVLRIAAMVGWIMGRGGGPSQGSAVMPAEDPPDDPAAAGDPGPEPEPDAAPAGGNPEPDESPRSATGAGTRYTCPDCGGVLFERHEGDLARFECSIGHVFSIESLASSQADALESALWAAVRSLEDRAALLERLAARAREDRRARSASTFERQAGEALDRAATIREAIQKPPDGAVAAGS